LGESERLRITDKQFGMIINYLSKQNKSTVAAVQLSCSKQKKMPQYWVINPKEAFYTLFFLIH
jgi:hypothetical protein